MLMDFWDRGRMLATIPSTDFVYKDLFTIASASVNGPSEQATKCCQQNNNNFDFFLLIFDMNVALDANPWSDIKKKRLHDHLKKTCIFVKHTENYTYYKLQWYLI